MPQEHGQPVLYLLTSHWMSMAGALLLTVAGCTWLLALPHLVRGQAANPYIGILLFVALPIVFVFGLILIPAGMWLSRHAVRQGIRAIPTREALLKRLAGFLIVATVLNVVIASQLSYAALHYMEGTQFCGRSCHVMKPEFTAHQNSPHARVLCVECHVTPGAVGWVKSKMAGTRQLIDVALNRYSRPIRSAMETNRLVPASETCEKCHWPSQFSGARLRVIPEYAGDQDNTLTQTVLMMMVGGGGVRGIHGAHFGSGVSMRYAATGSSRQTIPWVEYQNVKEGVTRTYIAEGFEPDGVRALQHYDVQCVDCHNRPTHTFQLPGRAVDRAMALGRLSTSLPFIKKTGVEVLQAAYASSGEAARKIPAAIRDYYCQSHPAIYQNRLADIDAAASALTAIYNENVFPELNVQWGTYANNLGHTDFPGCFRCHDDAHRSAGGKTITQDCSACHEIVASSEASPEVLKTLGIGKRLAALQKK